MLWPRPPGYPRTIRVAAGASHFAASDPLPLYVDKVVTEYDALWDKLRRPHPLDNTVIGTGNTGQEEARWHRWLVDFSNQPTNLSKPLIDVYLSDAARYVRTESTTSDTQSPQCIAHCMALEGRLLASERPAISDMPETLPSPSLAEIGDGGGGGGGTTSDDAEILFRHLFDSMSDTTRERMLRRLKGQLSQSATDDNDDKKEIRRQRP